MAATEHEVDLAEEPPKKKKKRGRPPTSTSKKQLRARARRKQLKADEALAALHKPIEEWDMEELAKGRPKAVDGTFRGRAPQWINRRVHEEAVRRFEQMVRTDMNVHTIDAVKVLGDLLNDDGTDANGKPVVPAATRAQIAEFLIEHIIGKPTSRVEQDISVRLQAVLGSAIVQPEATADMVPTAGFLGTGLVNPPTDDDIVDAEVVDDDDD